MIPFKQKNASILTKKLTKRMLMAYTVIYCCLIIVLLAILTPVLYNDTVKRNEEYTSLMHDQYQEFLTLIKGDLNYLASMPQINSLLKEVGTNYSNKAAALIEQALQSYAVCYERINLILIEDDKGNIYQTFRNSHSDALSVLQADENYTKLKEGNDSNYYSTYYSTVYPKDIWYFKETSSVSVSQKYSIYNHDFIFTIFNNTDDCLKNCESICDQNFSEYAVVTKDYKRSVYTTSEAFYTTVMDIFSEKAILYKGQLTDADGTYFYQKNPLTGWVVVTYVAWEKAFAGLFLIIVIIVGVYCISPILYCLFLIPTNTKYLRPLSQLTELISTYSAGDDLNLDIHTNDEIEILSDTLNKMSRKINQQISDIKKKEHENSITQYSLLATQIDPHFIYNTLNVVNIFARQNKNESVIDINTALSKILRERLNAKASFFESFERELDTINQFCVIMKYRYMDHVTVNISIEQELLTQKIPKNLLLPIVENSFYHGLSDENGVIKGNIDINIYALQERITIEISDDGIGINEENLEQLRKNEYQVAKTDRSHIGLTNVYERLRYVYYDDFKMDIQSAVGYGTTFSISLPFLNGEAMNKLL